MGRKLEMKKIQDITRCQVTYSKRRTSLIKKAHEICVFCDAEVALVMFSPSGRLSKYSTPQRIEQVLNQYISLPVEKRVRDLMKGCLLSMKNSDIDNIPKKMEKIWQLGHMRNDHQKLQYLDKQIENLELQVRKSNLELQIMEAGLRDYELLPGQVPSLHQLSWCERNLKSSLQKVVSRKDALSDNGIGSFEQSSVQHQPKPTSSLMETLMRWPSKLVIQPPSPLQGVNQVESQSGQPATPFVSSGENHNGVNQIKSQIKQPAKSPFVSSCAKDKGVNQFETQIGQPTTPIKSDILVSMISNTTTNQLRTPVNPWKSSPGLLGDVIRQSNVPDNLLGNVNRQSNVCYKRPDVRGSLLGDVICQLKDTTNVNLEFSDNSPSFNMNNVHVSNTFEATIKPRTMLPTTLCISSESPLMVNRSSVNSLNQNKHTSCENITSVPFSDAIRLSTPSLANFGDSRVTTENKHSTNSEIGASYQFPKSYLTQITDTTEEEIAQLGMDSSYSLGNSNLNDKNNEGVDFNEMHSTIQKPPTLDLADSLKEVCQDTLLPAEDGDGNDNAALVSKLRAISSWEWEVLLHDDFNMQYL